MAQIRKPDAGFCLQLLHIRPAVGSKNKGHLKILPLTEQIFRVTFSDSTRVILALVADDTGNIRVPLFRFDNAHQFLADEKRVIGVALFLVARHLVRRPFGNRQIASLGRTAALAVTQSSAVRLPAYLSQLLINQAACFRLCFRSSVGSLQVRFAALLLRQRHSLLRLLVILLTQARFLGLVLGSFDKGCLCLLRRQMIFLMLIAVIAIHLHKPFAKAVRLRQQKLGLLQRIRTLMARFVTAQAQAMHNACQILCDILFVFQQANFVYQCILHLIRHCYIVKVKHFINDIFAQQAQLKKAGVGITVQIALRELACFFQTGKLCA